MALDTEGPDVFTRGILLENFFWGSLILPSLVSRARASSGVGFEPTLFGYQAIPETLGELILYLERTLFLFAQFP